MQSGQPLSDVDPFAAALYRMRTWVEALSKQAGSHGTNNHANTAAIVNLIDAWVDAATVLVHMEVDDRAHYEIRSIRLVMYNASTKLTHLLNQALWGKLGAATYDSEAHLRARQNWEREQARQKLKIESFIGSNPGLSVAEIGRQLHKSYMTMREYIVMLKTEGRIHIKRSGRTHMVFAQSETGRRLPVALTRDAADDR